MLKSERENKIIQLLESKGSVPVKVLSEMLYASESSIRRDLTRLEDAGLIKRSYGGAELLNTNKYVLPFGTRKHDNISEKRKIAEKAVGLVGEGAVVFLDASSTAYFLALLLLDRADITVVTNSIEVLDLLSKGKPSLISTGGVLSHHNRICLIGRSAEQGFEQVFADLAFFSAKALDRDGVISDCTQEEVFVRDSMLKNARKRVGLFNGEKIGKRSSFKQCTLSEIDILISDEVSKLENFSDMCETM